MSHRMHAPRQANNTNRVLKGAQSQDDWISYRFAHANMRLRDRYSVEITRALYEKLSANFLKMARGIRSNSRGDMEGWVEVAPGIWACAAWKPTQRLIGTFLPCPPDFHGPAKVLVTEQPKQHKSMSQRQVRAVEVQQQAIAVPLKKAKETIGWIKLQLGQVRRMMDAGQIDEARHFLETIQGMPVGLHPADDLEKTKKYIEDRIAVVRQEREHRILCEYEEVRTRHAHLDPSRSALVVSLPDDRRDEHDQPTAGRAYTVRREHAQLPGA